MVPYAFSNRCAARLQWVMIVTGSYAAAPRGIVELLLYLASPGSAQRQSPVPFSIQERSERDVRSAPRTGGKLSRCLSLLPYRRPGIGRHSPPAQRWGTAHRTGGVAASRERRSTHLAASAPAQCRPGSIQFAESASARISDLRLEHKRRGTSRCISCSGGFGSGLLSALNEQLGGGRRHACPARYTFEEAPISCRTHRPRLPGVPRETARAHAS